MEISNPRTALSKVPWGQATAWGIASLFGAYLVYLWSFNFRTPNYTDYLSFWAAGRLALEGLPASAYDIAKHAAMIGEVTPVRGILAFPYPPPFLLFVTPFSIFDYQTAFAAWMVATGAAYVLATRQLLPTSAALSHPTMLMNGIYGQNGFLTAAIFIGGARLLSTRPFLAGAILGTLVIKPHLALLLPVAVIAARAWPAIAGAIISSVGLLLASFVLFGAAAYQGFLNLASVYSGNFADDLWPWAKLISPFAFLRYFGLAESWAFAIHSAVAAAAALLTWRAWARDWEEKLAILSAATLLISPYLFLYDALLLVVPMGFWITKQPRPAMVVLIWTLSLSPVLYHVGLYRGPSLIPVAAIISLFVLAARHTAFGARS